MRILALLAAAVVLPATAALAAAPVPAAGVVASEQAPAAAAGPAAAAVPAAGGEVVAVLPVNAAAADAGKLDLAALTALLRSAAAEAVAARGLTTTATQAGADLVLVSRALRVEGAISLSLALYRAGGKAPLATGRLAGIGLAALRDDARVQVAGLLARGLGWAAEARGEPPGPASAATAQPSTAQRATPRSSSAQRAPAQQAPSPAQGDSAPREPAPGDPAQPAPPAADFSARTQTRPDEDPAQGPSGDALLALIREVTAEVEAVRGLKRKVNLKVDLADDEAFARALRAKALEDLTPAMIAQERARWLAFGLAPPDADPGRILLDVLDEQVAGFYDPKTKVLTVRRTQQASVNLRDVLAHEIEHALQDQHFGIPDLKALPDDDARLARVALYEGDAMAVMAGVAARRAHRPFKVALASSAAALRNLDTDQLLKMSGRSSALLAAPAIVREELTLPYLAGLSLVAEVHRRGGFPLVNRMFAHPPATTHQVLHPDAYLAGEQPVQLAPPPAPKGTRLVATGRMGELGARVVLEVCVEKQVVRDFAGRWAGDAYSIVEDDHHALGLLWSTAWSGDGARLFANVLHMQQPCWDEGATAEGPRTIGAFASVHSEGGRTVLARGLAQLDAAAGRALATPAKVSPAVKPLGEVAPPVEARRTRIDQGRFVSERLGITGALPHGFTSDVDSPAAELVLQQPGSFASLTLVTEPLTPEGGEAFAAATAAQLSQGPLAGKALSLVSKGARELLGESAEERTWVVGDGSSRLRIALLPACEGRAFLALVRVQPAEGAQAALDAFAASLQRTPERAKACAELE